MKATPEPPKLSEGAPYGLSMGVPVVAVLDDEARLFGASMTRAEFLRMLLLRKAGLRLTERSPHAPTRKPIPGNRTPSKHTVQVYLDETLEGILLELCNRLGTNSRATVMSHLILEWAGISPLSPGFPFELPKSLRAPAKTTKRKSGRPSHDAAPTTFTFVQPLWDLLEHEARLHAQSSGMTLLRTILSGRMGLGTYARAPGLPAVAPLPNKEFDAVPKTVRFPRICINFVDEVSNRLGGGEKRAIVAHFFLEWLGVSPLSPDFVPGSSNGKR